MASGGVCNLTGAPARVDELLHFMVEIFATTVKSDTLRRGSSSNGRSTLVVVARHEGDEFAKHSELELELDAVHDALEHRLDDVVVGELDAEERNVHEDDEDVNSEELIQQFARVWLQGSAEDADGFDNID